MAFRRVSLVLAVLVITNRIVVYAAPAPDAGEVLDVISEGKIGKISNISCIVTPPDADIEWSFNRVPLDMNNTRFKVASERGALDDATVYFRRDSLLISDSKTSDHGVYGCHILDSEDAARRTFLNLSFPTNVVSQTKSPIRVNISDSVLLSCTFEGFNLSDVKWRIQINDSFEKLQVSEENLNYIKINETHINGTLRINNIAKKDNGTYVCGVREFYSKAIFKSSINVLVLDKPQISLDVVKAVGAERIFLNWTVNNGNLRIESYILQFMMEGSEEWRFYDTPIKGDNVSFVMKGLAPSTSYRLRITAKNSLGMGVYDNKEWVTTLKEDPAFIPIVSIKGFTTTSLTIGWNAPPEQISEYIHYYEILAKEKDSPSGTEIEAIHPGSSKNNPYMFGELEAATVYIFKVRACSEYTAECGEWSAPVNGSTMDGLSGPPIINSFTCKNDNISGTNFVYVAWDLPLIRRGQIIRYNVELIGNASFVNGDGKMETTTWGPKTKYVPHTTQNARFDAMPANTNFTIKVSAITRIKQMGEHAIVHCTTPPSTPPRDSLIGIRWDKVREGDSWLIKLNIPRVTERNGAICCYRVFIVRMKNQQRLNDMPSPEHLFVSSYRKVHNGKQSAGAYIAEIFTSKNLEPNVILGDGITYGAYSDDSLQQCKRCANILPKTSPSTTISTPTITTTHAVTTTDKLRNPTLPNDNVETSTLKIDIETTTISDKAGNTTTIETLSLNKDETPRAEKLESNKNHHAKKKKKTKRQDIKYDGKSQEESPLERYNLDSSNIDFIKNPDSNFNDDRKYVLDDDFYMKQRIHHQNKVKPYQSNANIAISETIDNEGLSEFDDDDFVESNPEDSVIQVANNELNDNDKLLRRHKIVLRHVSTDDFEKHLQSLATPDDENYKDIKLDINGLEVEIVDRSKIDEDEGDLPIYDGELDTESNYTGFLELLVDSGREEKMVPMYSDYFPVLKPGPNSIPQSEDVILQTALIVVGVGFLVVIIILCIVFCVIHNHNYRKARQHGVEMHTLQHTIRNIYQGLKSGRHQLVSQNPPNMLPLPKDKLLSSYTEKQADSGYEFQREFELLPDCFSDRTMDASEAKENQSKNRYPDIKAYDQTRVKLSQIDSIVGSDYINANFVLGYKERKKFICAQGPTDVTVDDFWRMIWEYNLELVVMLTNLEEYSKVKCSKYWPDQNQQDKLFNNINVHHVSEKRYSDYIIRELKITKQSLSHSHSSNQLIEANGISKKNGGINECNNSNGSASGTSEERIVHQYHFLMWKDFVAPEYPYAILKFIKRMNEACTAGRPILVHCSAGVGRTGTLVALDCLLEQMAAEGQVSIFNTICDLRRQRNFLVQSLKQYIFVYRALVEYANFNNTEIPAAQLKSTVDLLRQTAENSDTCLMEEEFERIKQPFLENLKPCIAGRAPENMIKNRNEAVVPYDHNRVILAPIPAKENSTYINASFIEGYDNSESYIIAQDPLPSTIPDFWRMVLEQEINTIVMLSELGEGKCPRYWDDDEIQYDHINVTYLLSESCPYYTRREFQVTNTKNQDGIKVTQLQYHGWPTVSGQVPEVTRGIIELVGQSGASAPMSPPILVHCSQGTDRSSMFVALSILTIQLRTEKRVDVSTVTRKLRSQRMGCLDTFLQYEFLHRAIVNYAELHNLISDS